MTSEQFWAIHKMIRRQQDIKPSVLGVHSVLCLGVSPADAAEASDCSIAVICSGVNRFIHYHTELCKAYNIPYEQYVTLRIVNKGKTWYLGERSEFGRNFKRVHTLVDEDSKNPKSAIVENFINYLKSLPEQRKRVVVDPKLLKAISTWQSSEVNTLLNLRRI
jgi:hypothetical protein